MSSAVRSIWVLVLFYLVTCISAQDTEQDRQLCERINRRCTEGITLPQGASDDSRNSLNQQCRIIRGPQWRDISRCQLVRVICELTIIRCQPFTCRNIERALERRN